MTVSDIAVLFPDWGAPEIKVVDGVQCVNAAGVLEIAKKIGNEPSRKFLAAVLREWRRVEDRKDLSITQKQQQVLSSALRLSGFTPISVEMPN